MIDDWVDSALVATLAAMTTELAPERVRLRTAADIVDAVPYLLGFPPQDSLVVIALRGARKRLGIVSRVDLPAPQDADTLAEHAVGYLRRDGADRAIAVFYPPVGGPEHPSVRPIADALRKTLGAAGIEMVDILCVGADRWWSLICTNSDCCAADGSPIAHEGTSVIAAASAVHGLALYKSRKELARSVEPVRGAVADAMTHALPIARADREARVAAGERALVCAEALDLLTRLIEARVDGTGCALTVDDAAQLVVAFDDLPLRDAMLRWHEGEWGNATRAFFAELVTLAVPPFEIAPLTVLGWLAYLQGDGAMANVIVERALGVEPRERPDGDTPHDDAPADDAPVNGAPADRPGYNLMRILDDALSRAINPKIFRESLTADGNWGDEAIPVTPRRPAYRRRPGRLPNPIPAASTDGVLHNRRSRQRRRR